MKFIIVKKRFLILLLAIFVVIISVMFVPKAVGVFSLSGRRIPIYGVKTDEKKIAISFDCAWGVDYTDKLLETMENENVICTFFMVEFWTKKYSDYVKKIYEKGHEIGTHSATHPYMSRLNKSQIENELKSSCKAIEDITNKKVELFRPPYGDYGNLLIDTASELELYTIQWSVDSLDWKDLSASEIEKRVMSKIKNGSIVLFHNNGLHTYEALPNIIKKLKEQNYEFVRIGDLIYRENYYVSQDGTQIKNN